MTLKGTEWEMPKSWYVVGYVFVLIGPFLSTAFVLSSVKLFGSSEVFGAVLGITYLAGAVACLCISISALGALRREGWWPSRPRKITRRP